MKLKFIEQISKDIIVDDVAADVVANVTAFSGLNNKAFWIMPPRKDGEGMEENADKATFVKIVNGSIIEGGIVNRSESLGMLVKVWALKTFVTCKSLAGGEDVKVLFRVKDREKGGMEILAIYDNAASFFSELLIMPVASYC